MKRSYFTICFLLFAFYSFADGEEVCVITNTGSSGQACTSSALGFVDPCSTLSFVVNYRLPQGFAIVAKYEWFVNGVSVKTTTDPSDPVLIWQIKAKTTMVYCKVTYKKQDGTLSQVYTSTSFTPDVKQLNFADNGITATTAMPNFGCTTNTVSFSLNTFTCTGNFCSGVYNVGQYSITWQPPSGWTQTSISPNGNNVSFLPDVSTGGTLTATITLPCGYTDTRIFTINRSIQKPTFSAFNNTICTSSANFSISPICGAIDYTYSIVGGAGLTFTSNGLQTLMTSSTNVSLSFSGVGTPLSLKVKANYPNSIVSGEESAELFYGTPAIGSNSPSLQYWYGNPSTDYNEVCSGQNFYTNMQVSGATSVVWSRIAASPSNTNWSQSGNNVNFYFWAVGQTAVFRINASNACGTTTNSFGFKSINCGGGGGGCEQYSVSPNPATSSLKVIVPNIPPPCDLFASDNSKRSITSQRTITEIKIYDNSGNLKKVQKENKAKQATLNLNGLKTGVYVIEIKDGNYIERQRIIIQE